MDNPSANTGAVGGAGGKEGEGALGAEEIGDRHGAQLGAVESLRRKGDGDPKHRAPDPGASQDGPERFRFAEQPE